MNNFILKVEDIYVAYEKKNVLKKINLKIAEGEKILLLGANGAGKSTFLKCIAGILQAREGKIFFKDHEINKISIFNRVKKGIVYLKQEREIFPHLTVKENLEIAGYELNKKELKIRIEKLIEVFPNIKRQFNKRAGLLSGGERRSLGILMVLIKEPHLLLLDEPTAGLAPKAAKEILKRLEIVQNIMQTTTLMVEHNIHLASEKVDRVIILKEGQIVFEENLKNKKLDMEKIFNYYF